MKKNKISPFEGDTWARLAKDVKFAEAFLAELSERPLPVQLGLLRKMAGYTQNQLATHAKLPQSFVSKLEKLGSDHRLSVYERIARLIHGRIVIIPEGAKIVFSKRSARLRAA